MKHASFDATCGVCGSLAGPKAEPRCSRTSCGTCATSAPPYGVAGWMLLVSQRHVAGPAHFDDREAASFGPTLRHLERCLEEITGALRIYTAAMGESHPHFHCHMVPRYPETPKGAKAWALFDLQRAAAAGEVTVDPAEVARISERYRTALAANPPPAP